MTKNSPLLLDRLRLVRDQRLLEMIYEEPVPVTLEAYHHDAEPIPFAEARAMPFTPFAVGDVWGRGWSTTWFRVTGTVPAGFAGRAVYLRMSLAENWGGEGFVSEALVYSKDGVPLRALNVNRQEVPVSLKAKAGEAFEFYIEAAANFASSDWLGDDGLPDFAGDRLCRVSRAELAAYNAEAHELHTDWAVALELLLALPEEGLRRGELLYALNAAANALHDEEGRGIAEAREILRPLLARKNGPTQFTASAIGHAHIDTAWLWPLRETIRKCARTFSSALRYMEKYPDYVFGCSQPQQYEWMKRYYPSIYKDIKAAVKRGQWEPMGSMWIEADCNMPSGESLVRQLLLGKAFFQKEFGLETKDLWLPDVFGYAASLPQILRKSGVEYFLTQKISWNQYNQFPHHTFYWEGIDGTEIFTHFPPNNTYNDTIHPEKLLETAKKFRDKDRASRFLVVYGYGDGGGGPSEEMLRKASRMKDLEGLPRLELEKISEFFPKAVKDAKAPPRWVGELYLELHRGTLTTHARNKRSNRKCEFLLREAEFFTALDTKSARHEVKRLLDDGRKKLPSQAVYDCADASPALEPIMERAWKLLLLNQFHDIIPGSSITWVYKDSDRDYETINSLGGLVLDAGVDHLLKQIDTSKLEQPVVVLNSLNFARDEIVDLPNGEVARVHVPSCGYAAVNGERASHLPLDQGLEPVALEQKGEEKDATWTLDNGLVQVTLDSRGLVSRFYDVQNDREVLAPGAVGNLLQLHEDQPNKWEAWDIDIHYREKVRDLTDLAEPVRVVETGPLRVTLEIVRNTGKSRITQRISLCAGSAELRFDTEVDWHESRKLLKAAFPVDIHANQAHYEIQFGHLRRPNHANTSWDEAQFEVVAQKWAALLETGYGVALLNDCKYGHDILGNTMRLTLLRSPNSPDPKADQGQHSFSYALYPFAGDLVAGRVVEQALAFNVPLQVRSVPNQKGARNERESFLEVDRPGLILSSLKTAEDGKGVILRFYEAHGARGKFLIHHNLPYKKAALTDLLERHEANLPMEGRTIAVTAKPFEIITVRLF